MIRIVLAAMLAALALVPAAAGTIVYYHNDLAGSPIAATNESGQVIWRESYRPYGERLTNDPQCAADKIWFTSRSQDAATGLVYMGARWYDPLMGRFISTDPKRFDEQNLHSFNRYAYANNNPLKYVDPDGKAAMAIARGGFLVAKQVATALGAGAVGSWIGLRLHDVLRQEQAGDDSGAKGAPTAATDAPSQEWIYGPKDDLKVNPDGSTKPNTWTSLDKFPDRETAADKLDPFKPVEGRRPVTIPEGTDVKRGRTPGGEGPFNGRGGGRETLIPGGLPSGSAGQREPLP